MLEIGLDTLLLSGECDVQWGTRGSAAAVHRTIEIHSNNNLYCFVEPKNSMAKHAKEKIYLEGCRVVDGGAYADSSERLLLFLVNYDYAEEVDIVGNRRAYMFTAEARDRHRGPHKADSEDLPSADYVVQLFLADKMLKWRLLQAIQRASQSYAQLFPESPTGHALSLSHSGSGKGTAEAGKGSFAMFNVPNRFESKVLGRPAAVHSRQSSDISVLSDHEVLQLSDVLREYDAMQKRQEEAGDREGATGSATSPLVPPRPLGGQAEDARRHSAAEEEMLEESSAVSSAASVPQIVVEQAAAPPASPLASTASSVVDGAAAAIPARLQHSPLFDCCIRDTVANQSCADCGAAFPSWCLLQPFGAFVCIECIGVHRKLWSNRCRGAELDLWPAADVAFMQSRGNAVVNDELEYYVAFPADSVEAAMHVDPPVKPVCGFSAIDVRESYIQWKYEEQLFTRQRHPGKTEPLPPRQDPLGLDHARLSATAAAASDREGGDGYASDGVYGSPTHQQQQQQQRAFLRDDGPPRYAGLLDIVVKELVGPGTMLGAVCVLTNGFQTLRTHRSRHLMNINHATVWDEHVQLGIEGAARKPIYCTIYRGKGELLATGEVWLKEEVFQPGTTSMFAATLTWSQLHKKASQRSAAERWKITLMTSYQMLL